MGYSLTCAYAFCLMKGERILIFYTLNKQGSCKWYLQDGSDSYTPSPYDCFSLHIHCLCSQRQGLDHMVWGTPGRHEHCKYCWSSFIDSPNCFCESDWFVEIKIPHAALLFVGQKYFHGNTGVLRVLQTRLQR